MPSKSTLIKIGVFAALGTGIVCLVDGLLWDLAPFNKYQGMFWVTFLPLILFFMREHQDRKYLINMWISFVCGLIWGLPALGAIMALSPVNPVLPGVVINFAICGLIVFVHKGLLDKTPANAVACVFLGFALTLGCMSTGFTVGGQVVAPATLNGIDMLIIFTWGLLIAFFVSLLGDFLIGKFVMAKLPGGPQGAEEQ